MCIYSSGLLKWEIQSVYPFLLAISVSSLFKIIFKAPKSKKENKTKNYHAHYNFSEKSLILSSLTFKLF